MAVVYIEPRPKGREEHAPIEDYVVESEGGKVLETLKTQADAIKWAKDNGYTVHVARVRHLPNKANPGSLAKGLKRSGVVGTFLSVCGPTANASNASAR